jgi:hypothetical protein
MKKWMKKKIFKFLSLESEEEKKFFVERKENWKIIFLCVCKCVRVLFLIFPFFFFFFSLHWTDTLKMIIG